MTSDSDNDMTFDNILSLGDIKNDKYVVERIIWGFEPKRLMEPHKIKKDDGEEIRNEIKGYFFYIETMDEKPALFLMRHTAFGYAETVAKVDEIPDELLAEAIDENKDRGYFGMYPVNKKVEDWLKKELA